MSQETKRRGSVLRVQGGWDDGSLKVWVVMTMIWVGAILLIVSLAIGALYGITRPTCHRTGSAMDRPARWSLLAGCFVQGDDGRWYPPENIREPEGR